MSITVLSVSDAKNISQLAQQKLKDEFINEINGEIEKVFQQYCGEHQSSCEVAVPENITNNSLKEVMSAFKKTGWYVKTENKLDGFKWRTLVLTSPQEVTLEGEEYVK